MFATDKRWLGRPKRMRALAVAIGLFALGTAGALATAPRTDPQEDLFSTKASGLDPAPTRSQPPKPDASTAPKPSPGVAQRAPAVAAEPQSVANPLWAIPLSRLTATRDRPPFSPSRRPAPVAPVVPPSAPVAAAPQRPAEPDKPRLSLVGTISGGAGRGIGLFMNAADKNSVRLKLGENHDGWILRAVRPRQVELAKGLESTVLDLPPPDMKAAAAASPLIPVPPSAPPGAPTPIAPATVSMSGPPGSTLPPVQGAAASMVQPPVLSPPPPPPVNPFRNGRLPRTLE